MPRTEFQVHLLNETGIARAKHLAEAFSSLLTLCESYTDAQSSEDSDLVACRQRLMEASFHAKRAMACNPENQK